MVVKKPYDVGVRNEHACLAAFASTGTALATWLYSHRAGRVGGDRAHRWGIVIGEWAPPFFALGLALSPNAQSEGSLSPD